MRLRAARRSQGSVNVDVPQRTSELIEDRELLKLVSEPSPGWLQAEVDSSSGAGHGSWSSAPSVGRSTRFPIPAGIARARPKVSYRELYHCTAELRPRAFSTRSVAIATLRNWIAISMEHGASPRPVRPGRYVTARRLLLLDEATTTGSARHSASLAPEAENEPPFTNPNALRRNAGRWCEASVSTTRFAVLAARPESNAFRPINSVATSSHRR